MRTTMTSCNKAPQLSDCPLRSQIQLYRACDCRHAMHEPSLSKERKGAENVVTGLEERTINVTHPQRKARLPFTVLIFNLSRGRSPASSWQEHVSLKVRNTDSGNGRTTFTAVPFDATLSTHKPGLRCPLFNNGNHEMNIGTPLFI